MSTNNPHLLSYAYPPLAPELPFQASPDTTLGVELELQVVDPDTGELVPGAQRILDACAEEGVRGVDGEYLLSMLEVRTDICRNVAEVQERLFPVLRRVRAIAGSLGYHLAVGGTHPCSRPRTCVVSPQERYRRISRRQGWLAYHEEVFGLHVHVGVPDGERAVALINLLAPYLPHLLALSANSPFWQGIDTGYASARLVMFRPSPHSGIPQYCASWAEFCHYFAVLRDGGAMESPKDVYWDLRPRPDLGTIEFRICDAPAAPALLLGLAALARCLVQEGLRLLEERPGLGPGDRSGLWLALENRARASRYGLEAECVRRPGRGPQTLADDAADLLERLAPLARDLGEDHYLAVFQPLDHFQTGAEAQRHLFRQTGHWPLVLDEMKNRWFRDMETLALPPAPALPAAPPARHAARPGERPNGHAVGAAARS